MDFDLNFLTETRIAQAKQALAEWDRNPAAQARRSEVDVLAWIFGCGRADAHALMRIARQRMAGVLGSNEGGSRGGPQLQ